MKSFILVEITMDELESLPVDLQKRITRRWKRRMAIEKKSDEFCEMMDGDQ
jgi:hypothetical protein